MELYTAIREFGFAVAVAAALVYVFIWLIRLVINRLISNDIEARKLFLKNDEDQRRSIDGLENRMGRLQEKIDILQEARIQDARQLMDVLNKNIDVIANNSITMKESTIVVTKQSEYLKHIVAKYVEFK